MAWNFSIVDSSGFEVIENSSDSDEYINIMWCDSMEERELNESIVSNDKLGKIKSTTIVNISTPKQSDGEKSKLGKLKTKEKRKHADEKVEKERETKKPEKKKKETKEVEKRLKREDKESEIMRKKEEKRQTQEEEDDHYKELLKVSQKVFAHKKSAPTVRTEFDSFRKTYLEDVLLNPNSKVDLNLLQYKGTRGRICDATYPLNEDFNSVTVIDECGAALTSEDVKTIVRQFRHRKRSKLLQFCENRRPAYWGTWWKTSYSVGPRRPFGKENILNYNVDSDDEWGKEVEPGESLTDSDGEDEDKEPANNRYKIDYEFTVPDGYLSEEEIPKDDNEPVLLPSAVTEAPYKRVSDVKPSVIGCCWSDDLNPNSHAEVLQHYAAVVLSSTPSIKLVDDDTVRKRKSIMRPVSEKSIPALIRLLHGSACSKLRIVKEFLLYLERNPSEKGEKVPSQMQILTKIAQIASLDKCTEVGALNGKMCYFVHPEVLARYNLTNLSPIGQQYVGNSGLCHQDEKARTQSQRTDEDIPPAKAPRVPHQ